MYAEVAKGASVKKTKQDLKWEAESDVRTLTNAAEIRKDPARLKRARAEAKSQMEALKGASSK